MNKVCPRCGSHKVQLSDNVVKQKHGLFWWLVIGWWWAPMVCLFKWSIGITVFLCWDIWAFLIKTIQKKGYVWRSKKYFSSKKVYYYCHDCGYNFKQ